MFSSVITLLCNNLTKLITWLYSHLLWWCLLYGMLYEIVIIPKQGTIVPLGSCLFWRCAQGEWSPVIDVNNVCVALFCVSICGEIYWCNYCIVINNDKFSNKHSIFEQNLCRIFWQNLWQETNLCTVEYLRPLNWTFHAWSDPHLVPFQSLLWFFTCDSLHAVLF